RRHVAQHVLGWRGPPRPAPSARPTGHSQEKRTQTMRFHSSQRTRRALPHHKQRLSHRLVLEQLEDRVLPSVPDGTIVVTTSHSAFSSVPPDSFPIGLVGVTPGTGSQFPISTGGLFALPTYVTEAPDGQLYVTDLQAFSTGIVVRVDTNNVQHLVARGGFLNG